MSRIDKFERSLNDTNRLKNTKDNSNSPNQINDIRLSRKNNNNNLNNNLSNNNGVANNTKTNNNFQPASKNYDVEYRKMNKNPISRLEAEVQENRTPNDFDF